MSLWLVVYLEDFFLTLTRDGRLSWDRTDTRRTTLICILLGAPCGRSAIGCLRNLRRVSMFRRHMKRTSRTSSAVSADAMKIGGI